MKHREIRTLYRQHRDLFAGHRYKNNAMPNRTSVKGLGRSWSWQEFVEADKSQTAVCSIFPETDMPYRCFDGRRKKALNQIDIKLPYMRGTHQPFCKE